MKKEMVSYYRALTFRLVINPKFILCPMFKAGMCEKGKKCKNSHDFTNAEAK
jgi:hypothetical protein